VTELVRPDEAGFADDQGLGKGSRSFKEAINSSVAWPVGFEQEGNIWTAAYRRQPRDAEGNVLLPSTPPR
jgi:hypothetical protein